MEKEKSCGCIIIDQGQVLLIHQTNDSWGFPKGHVEGNETEQETALREEKEETNLEVEIVGNYRYTIEYSIENGNLKEVVYFVAKKIGGSEQPQEGEVYTVEWMDLKDAIEKITYDNNREVLQQVIQDIQ